MFSVHVLFYLFSRRMLCRSIFSSCCRLDIDFPTGEQHHADSDTDPHRSFCQTSMCFSDSLPDHTSASFFLAFVEVFCNSQWNHCHRVCNHMSRFSDYFDLLKAFPLFFVLQFLRYLIWGLLLTHLPVQPEIFECPHLRHDTLPQ